MTLPEATTRKARAEILKAETAPLFEKFLDSVSGAKDIAQAILEMALETAGQAAAIGKPSMMGSPSENSFANSGSTRTHCCIICPRTGRNPLVKAGQELLTGEIGDFVFFLVDLLAARDHYLEVGLSDDTATELGAIEAYASLSTGLVAETALAEPVAGACGVTLGAGCPAAVVVANAISWGLEELAAWNVRNAADCDFAGICSKPIVVWGDATPTPTPGPPPPFP